MSTQTVDVFANIPQINPSLGNDLWKGVGEGLDFFINKLIIEEGGKLLGAGLMAAAGKTLDVAANVTNVAAGVAQAPFQPGFIASSTPAGETVRSPEVPGRTREIAMDTTRADLGQLVPAPTSGMAVPNRGYEMMV